MRPSDQADQRPPLAASQRRPCALGSLVADRVQRFKWQIGEQKFARAPVELRDLRAACLHFRCTNELGSSAPAAKEQPLEKERRSRLELYLVPSTLLPPTSGRLDPKHLEWRPGGERGECKRAVVNLLCFQAPETIRQAKGARPSERASGRVGAQLNRHALDARLWQLNSLLAGPNFGQL